MDVVIMLRWGNRAGLRFTSRWGCNQLVSRWSKMSMKVRAGHQNPLQQNSFWFSRLFTDHFWTLNISTLDTCFIFCFFFLFNYDGWRTYSPPPPLFSALPLSSHFKRDSDFSHVRPTLLTCSSLSSTAMVPYVCQNVYVVCFFRPDSFPCLLSDEPRSPRGGEPMPHAIYTDWTAGALPAKAVRDEGSGEGRGNYHRNFRLNQAFEMSLCFLSLLISLLQFFLPPSVFCVSPPTCPGAGTTRSCPYQVGWTDITHSFRFCSSSPYLSSVFGFRSSPFCFCCSLLCSWWFFFLVPKTHFLSPLPIKELAVLDWIKRGWFSLQLRFNTLCPFVAMDKAELLSQNSFFSSSFLLCVRLPSFSSSWWLPWCLSYCEPQSCEVLSKLLFPSLISFHLLSRLLYAPLPQLFVTWTTWETRKSQAYRCSLQFKTAFAVRRPITGMLS